MPTTDDLDVVALQILKKGRELISAPNGFCKNSLCREKATEEPSTIRVAADAPQDYSYCMIGALCVSGIIIEGNMLGRGESVADSRLRQAYGDLGLVAFNNAPETIQQDVVAVFDKAIANMEAAA